MSNQRDTRNTVPILSLGEERILDILNKMDNRTLSRMRTTCESIASIVKLNDHDLAKRTYFGVSLSYEDHSGDLIYSVKDKEEKMDYDIPEEELIYIMAGVPIHKISVSVWEKYFDFVVASLISLQPTTAILCIEDQNPLHIVQITDVVECQGNIDVTLNLSEEFVLRGISVTEEDLPILANARKSSTFNVNFEGPFVYYDGMMTDLLKFKTFETLCQMPDAIPLLQELYDSEGVGSLTKFSCALENKPRNTSVFEDDSCPPGILIHGEGYAIHDEPTIIHTMEFKNKIAVVIEDENLTIHFVENQYEVLAVLSSSVDLSRFMYDDILVTTESLPILAEMKNNATMMLRFFGSFVYYDGMMADILKFYTLTALSPLSELVPSLLMELSFIKHFGNLTRFSCKRPVKNGQCDISIFMKEGCPSATFIWSKADFAEFPSHTRTGFNKTFDHDHPDFIHTMQLNGKTAVIIEDENISIYLVKNLSEILDLISSVVKISGDVMDRILTRNGEKSEQALLKGYNAYLEAVKLLNTRLNTFNFFKDHPDFN